MIHADRKHGGFLPHDTCTAIGDSLGGKKRKYVGICSGLYLSVPTLSIEAYVRRLRALERSYLLLEDTGRDVPVVSQFAWEDGKPTALFGEELLDKPPCALLNNNPRLM